MTRFVDRAVGIDLGTTHSEIALLDPSERDLVIYADRHGRKTVPSAVGWDPATERIVVGRAARALRGKEPPPIESVKRKMGQAVTFALGPHVLSPEQVSAEILKELVRCMGEELARRAPAGVEVRLRRAVITVPAYFDGPQVEATRRAGELAGLEVIGILQEPTAAALYAEWKHRIGDGTRLVYDLGGGTFDVSVLRAVAGEHRVIAIDGDNYLGGDDFDRRFAERLRQRLCERGWALALDPNDPEDALRMVRLAQLAQEAKEQLSSSEVVHLSRPAWMPDRDGELVDVDLEVSRAEHEATIADLIDATIARTELALARAKEVAGVGIEDVDRVLLVGGSTRVPAVARRVEQALAARSKSPAVLADEVDTSVALGAALYAATLGGLSFGDGEVELRATSPLVTRTDTLRLALALTRVPDGASSLVIEGEGGVEHARLEIAPAVRATLPIFADGEPAEQQLTLRIEGDGGTLASLPLTVWRAEVGPRPSALSRAAVMAKDLSVEIARGTRRERKVLVPRGATLPTETSTELFTGDRTGTVVLRLCSGLLPIQTLALEVPTDLPVGTPVTLKVTLSESMALDARATVAGRELWSRIEPAALTALPQREELEAMLASGERLEAALWGHRRTLFSWAFRPLAAGLREAASSDPDRVRALAAQLERLLVETGEGEEGLTPPWEHFEGTLDAIRRIAFRGGDVMGQDPASWTTRLNGLAERGHAAQRALDAAAWRTVNDEAQAIHETLATQLHAAIDTSSPAYLRLRQMSARRHAEQLAQQLRSLVLSSAPELRALQERERDRLALELGRESLEPLAALDVDGAPSEARQVLNRVSIMHERIEAALERIPSLGLVRAER
jgi:molecular chaperone DnaK